MSEVYAFGGTPFNSRTAPLNKWRRFYRGGERVGHATSVTWSPTVERVIGFAHIHPAAADPGTEVTLGWDVMGEEHPVGGTVVELPFLPMRRAAG